MMVLITYDVALNSESGSTRLRHIAKICQDYGTRVQYSVFECEVDPAQWVELKAKLFREYDKARPVAPQGRPPPAVRPRK